MSTLRDDRGFALPMAILVIVLHTIMLTAAFAVVSSEMRIVDNARDQLQASTLAQSGLELFLVARDSLGLTASPPAETESVRVELDRGYADVTLERVREGVQGAPALYVIRSQGVMTDPEMPGVPRAERTVAQYATWSSASVTIGAAWTALTGFHRNGSSGVISGIDQCGVEPEVAGMATASPPGYTQSGGGRSHLRGSPPLRSLGSYDEAAASIPWDWADIVEGGALLPDITIPGDRWPDSFSSEDWPIILVNGDLSLPSSGHGLLVVTGSLRMNGRVDWAGLVLVGDRVTGNGNNGIQGAVFSGLNVLLGEPSILGPTIGTNSVGNGTKRIHYNSCAISLALEGLGGLVAIPNTWSDNWAMY